MFSLLQLSLLMDSTVLCARSYNYMRINTDYLQIITNFVYT